MSTWRATARTVVALGLMLAPAVQTRPATARVPVPFLAGPIPRSVWLYEPDPAALPLVNARLDEVLSSVTAENRNAMADTEVRIHVIPQDWKLTDLPVWSYLKGALLPDPNPLDGYTEQRSYDGLRGLGPPYCISEPLDIAIGEELLAIVPPGLFSPAAPAELGRILIHEVGHSIDCSLSTAQDKLLDTAYAAAVERQPEGIIGESLSYTTSTRREYFAEGVVAWFEAGRNPSYRRTWVREHDPALYGLLSQVFDEPAPIPTCNGRRATTILHANSGPYVGTPGDDVVVGTPEADNINGAGGDDIICGGDGDDVLVGGFGSDRILGGLGDDSYAGGSGDDILHDAGPGSGGNDTMDGGPGNDKLSGGAGDDVLADGDGADHLVGGSGDDQLDTRDEQAPRPDRLDGSDGYDTCTHDLGDTVIGCYPRPTTTTTTTTTTLPPTTTTTTTPTTPTTPPVTTLPSPREPEPTSTTSSPLSTSTSSSTSTSTSTPTSVPGPRRVQLYSAER